LDNITSTPTTPEVKIFYMVQLATLRYTLSPVWRGALFYLGYWGIMGVFEPFMNVHFVRLGLSGREIGFLSALIPLMTLVVTPLLAALADRQGQRVLAISIFVGGLAVVLLLLGIPRTFIALLPLMTLYGVFRSSVAPLADSVIVRMSIRHRLNYGNLRMWGSFSFALIVLCFGLLWQRWSFEPMFITGGLLFLPVIISAIMLEEGPPVAPHTRRPLKEMAGDLGLIAILGATFLIQAGFQLTFTFGGIFMDDLNGSQSLMGLMFMITALMELPMMQYSDRIMNRLGGPGTLLLAYSLGMLGLLAYALAWAPWVLILASAVRGLGFGLYFVSTVRSLDNRVPEEWSSSVQGIMNAGALGLAPLIATPIAGELYDQWGAPAVFWFSAGLAGLAVVVLGWALARGLLREPRN
jgi:PPP family 3-phenylpropionic acid transporter